MLSYKIKKLLLGTAALLAIGFIAQTAEAASGSVSGGGSMGATSGAGSGNSGATGGMPGSETGSSVGASTTTAQAGGAVKATASRDPATSPNNPDVRSGANQGVSSTIGDGRTEASQTPIRPYVVSPSK